MSILRYIKSKIQEFIRWSVINWNFPELRSKKHPIHEDKIHLESAMKWLCLAQDITGVGGVSALYDLQKKEWDVPYRETTGYIIETFINYSKISGNNDYEKRALEMGLWEIKEQLSDGSFGETTKDNLKKGLPLNKKVFNTGQIILGLCRLYDHTGEEKFLRAAVKSVEWLISIQEDDGRWEKYTTKGAKTYHARVAWPILEVYKRTRESKFKICAEKNLKWVLSQQNIVGWFNNCSLSEKNKPWTHLIAYTIRGLLESSEINKSQEIFSSAYKAAERILEKYNESISLKFNFLPGTFDENWESKDRYSCLTGDMQMAIIWLKLFKITKEERFSLGAKRIIEQVKETQMLSNAHKELVGGIAGSFPIEGNYASYAILNWATKFFADTLMLKINSDISL